MGCPYDPEVLRYERGSIPVLSAASYPAIIDDDGLVERLDAIREKFPFVKFEGDPAIHFLGWNALGEIYRNWPLFSNAAKHEAGYKAGGDMPLIPSGYDPPVAHNYKQFLQRKYGEADAHAFEPVARRRAAELIDGFVARGECEYMEEFAARYFGPILLGYVGIPEADVDRIQDLEQDTFRTAEVDPDGAIRANAARTLSAYLIDLVQTARAALPPEGQRKDDLLTFMLTEPMGNGQTMRDEEIKAALHIMCLGGAHSVKAALGYAMKLLADRPELRSELFDADGSAKPYAIDELLRWNGVGGGMNHRKVTRDTELAGCPLEKGDLICTVMTAANHDPCASEDADRLRFDRASVRSFTFSFGTHRCLGIHFAKLGLKVAVEEWHKRVPAYRVAPGARIREQIWAGVGYLSLPLTWQEDN